MWVQPDVVREQRRDRLREAERYRLAARAKASRKRASSPEAGQGWRAQEILGWALVRAGLRVLDARRA